MIKGEIDGERENEIKVAERERALRLAANV